MKSLWKMDLGSKFILVKRLDIRASFFFLSKKKRFYLFIFIYLKDRATEIEKQREGERKGFEFVGSLP